MLLSLLAAENRRLYRAQARRTSSTGLFFGVLYLVLLAYLSVAAGDRPAPSRCPAPSPMETTS